MVEVVPRLYLSRGCPLLNFSLMIFSILIIFIDRYIDSQPLKAWPAGVGKENIPPTSRWKAPIKASILLCPRDYTCPYPPGRSSKVGTGRQLYRLSRQTADQRKLAIPLTGRWQTLSFLARTHSLCSAKSTAATISTSWKKA